MLKGQLRANAIAIAAFQVSFLNQAGAEIKAEAKMIDTASGRTHATAYVVAWTPEVLAKLKELVDAMELAAGRVLFTAFEEGGAAPEKPGLRVEEQPSGLEAHLAGEPLRQI